MVTDPDFETKYPKAARQGSYEQVDIVPSYVDHLLSYIDTKEIAPLNIVANPRKWRSRSHCKGTGKTPALSLYVS